jgi:hypothetical protein
MRISWLLAISCAISAGAVFSACGGGGSSGTNGAGGSGHTGAGGATGVGGGLGFDAGSHDAALMKDGDACGSVAIATHMTPGNIVVVFDQSDSMKNAFNGGDAGASGPKWQVAEDALVAAIKPIQGILNLGSIFFPTIATGNTCSKVDPITKAPQIPIEPGAMFVTDFQAHFSAAGWTLILGTPLKDALDEANAALPDPSPLMGQRAVVILTDGAPTCTTGTNAILMPVQAMASRGIKTYAVGLPGSQAASTLLNAIAAAGGSGMYLTPSDPAALQAALAQIASSTIDQCTVTLDPPPADPTQVHLIVTDAADPNGVEIMQTNGTGDGWTLAPDGKTATLTGAVCDKAKNGGYSSIQFVYGCPSLPH